MINAKRLLYEYNRKFDRFNGQYEKTLRLEDKFAVINEAITVYVNNRIRIAKSNAQVREDLRPLEIKEFKLKKVKDQDGYSVFEIPEDCLRIQRRTVYAKRPECDLKVLPVYMFQTNDLNNANKSLWKSSFEWEQVVGDDSSDGLYLWHNNEFSIEKVTIDYYKKHPEVHCPTCEASGSYEDWNGKIQSADVGTIFSEKVMYEFLDIAILMTRRDLGDSVDYPLTLSSILQIQNIDSIPQ